MNKNKLLKLLDSLKIDKNEYFVLSTSSLLLRDLIDKANDLDIAVTSKGLEELKENYNLKQKENGWYIINDMVECVLDDDIDTKAEKIGDYYLHTLENYYNYIKDSTREKDKIKLEIIKKELDKGNTNN